MLSISLPEEAEIPHWKSKLGGAATPEMLKQISGLQSQDWEVLVPMTKLHAGHEDTRYNYHAIDNRGSWTHVRLNIYPDGGIARLRLYGEARPNWKDVSPDEPTDLIAMVNGGTCLGYSDAHYGHPRNIIRPGRGVNMADGWETARQLDRPSILEADSDGMLQMPGCEWAVFQLGHCGYITHIEVDTYHFKGNYPDSIRIEGTTEKPHGDWGQATWYTLLPPQKLCPHTQHFYSEKNLETTGSFMYIRVTIAPDGGISRLRLWGYRHNST
ncbi:allantoicase-like [Cryptotermes secundus]|uniref:allantoicase-like n=1 Tax=Cryptotermes secundus TaxID=105785 RepID=UPI000CD7BACC|nr:allantoicase-like [Cryptotermes secundus]